MISESEKKIQEFLFDRMLESNHEYGIRYVNSDIFITFKKVGNKLTTNSDCYEKIKKIVSEEYFNKTFIPLEHAR
jgi:hypothetical protein